MLSTSAARRCSLTFGLICLVALVTGCSSDDASRPIAAQTVENPASLVDGYLIARGMALSYGHSGRAGMAEITQLVRYDRAALVAVVAAQLEPDRRSSRQAEQAVAALVDYTGENDLRSDTAPPASIVR